MARRSRIFEDYSAMDVYVLTPGRYDNIYAASLLSIDELADVVQQFNFQPALVVARDPEEAIDQGVNGYFINILDAFNFIEQKYHKDPARMNPRKKR